MLKYIYVTIITLSELQKRIIKCFNCKNVFFTKKVTLTKQEIHAEKSKLSSTIKNYEDEINDLNVQMALIDEKIIKRNQKLRELQKELSELNFIVQCSACGIRLSALDNEVKAI